MEGEEPKDRLRRAREGLHFSRELLAAKLGRAASTVRAHENGQNRIQPDAAAAYARELGVSAAWLLYGVEDSGGPIEGLATRAVEVVGEIWDWPHFIKEDDETKVREYLSISLPEYRDRKLSAFVEHYGGNDYLYRHYVIVANVVDELSLVDEVVLRYREGSFSNIGRWRIGAQRGWRVFYQGPDQAAAQKLIKVTAEGNLDDFYEVLGVVVADLTVRRRIASVAPVDPEGEVQQK